MCTRTNPLPWLAPPPADGLLGLSRDRGLQRGATRKLNKMGSGTQVIKFADLLCLPSVPRPASLKYHGAEPIPS